MKRLVFPLALFLTACGDGASFNEPAFEPAPIPSTVTLLVTDAPLDTVQEVYVQFASITLVTAGGDTVDLPLAQTASIDLLRLQGGTTDTLVSVAEVPPGNYTSVRIRVNADFDGIFDSYVVRDGGQVEIQVPSQEFEVSGSLDVAAAVSRSFVIDWDLRQSLTEPAGQLGFVLNPQVRLLDVLSSGTLSGSVSDLLINDELNGSATCNNDLGRDVGNAVYLYSGNVATPNDIQPADVSPLATASVASASP